LTVTLTSILAICSAQTAALAIFPTGSHIVLMAYGVVTPTRRNNRPIPPALWYDHASDVVVIVSGRRWVGQHFIRGEPWSSMGWTNQHTSRPTSAGSRGAGAAKAIITVWLSPGCAITKFGTAWPAGNASS